MISFVAIILLGFFLGMRHAMDPDHVIAVTTIVSRQRAVVKAALIGVLWGLGHTFTIFVLGAAIILFNAAIPPRLGLSMELSVGIMLVLLGALNLTGVLRWLTEKFTPADPQESQIPMQQTVPSSLFPAPSSRFPVPSPSLFPIPCSLAVTPQGLIDRTFQGMGTYQVLRPLMVGIVHGLAGSAAVALLLMTTIRNPWWAIAYLLVFGAGTIAGMMLITAVIALPFVCTAERFGWLNRGLATASGVLSLGFGFFLAYQIGFVDGLFTSHPQWTPR